MNILEIDPQFTSYLREPPRLSYSNPEDPWLSRHLVSSLEVLLGRNRMEQIYYRTKNRGLSVQSFFAAALEETQIDVQFDSSKLESIPKTGPLMFVANHPFGVVDGIVLCDLALKVRGEIRIMINSLLCQDKDLAPYFLPIDFEPSKKAVTTNIRSKQLALEYLSQDIPVLIFPAGMVSTAGRFGFGPVIDAPWTTFAAKVIREAEANVVPVFFHGANSRKFHIASHFAEPLRMALLIHEALRKFGESVKVEIGAPIWWETLAGQGGRSQLTYYLYQQVQKLSKS